MKIALVHYHLNRGGVTRVIENQLLALDAVLEPGQTLPVALIYGGRRVGWPKDLPERLRSVRLTLHTVPQLDYDEQRPAEGPGSGGLDEQLTDVLEAVGFAARDSVVHVHNHAVGKNVCLPSCVWQLAERGYALLLQLHDFAEDFRPANFQRLSRELAGGGPAASWHGRLYPQAPHVHYAVLSGRDRRILEAAGVGSECLHLLPNPVPGPQRLPARQHARGRLAEKFAVSADDRFVLYPVRCIRRKNTGEALLYGKLSPPGTVIGLTLPPLNPAEKPVYARWKQVSAHLGLPCLFEVGAPGKLSLDENLAASDLILTTSVAEGFGMVFLESWLAQRPLAGRDLPEITSDFTRAGLRLDGLQPQLPIPISWVGARAFRQTVLDAYRSTLAAFDRPQPVNLSDALDAKTRDELVDFADLDEPMQEQVIQRVCNRESDRRRVLECNPSIERALSDGAAGVSNLIRQNRQAIGRHFSLPPSGRRLWTLYQQVVSSGRDRPPQPLSRPDRILDGFLDLRRFRLIRSEVTRVTSETAP